MHSCICLSHVLSGRQAFHCSPYELFPHAYTRDTGRPLGTTSHSFGMRGSVFLPRKEVIHRQLPLAMPCYDLLLITDLTVVLFYKRPLGIVSSSELTGGEYKARERIHRGEADPRLLAIPASRSRVADSDPNCDRFCRFAPGRPVAALCTGHCSTCVAQGVRAVMI